MAEASMLDREAIARRIPHAGRMVLLDRVLEWDARSIRCATRSHLDPANPLREPAGLPVWAGIEYAAQAAALHGALRLATPRPRAGVLGKLRHVRPGCEWLDRIASPLIFAATLLHHDSTGGIYDFEAHGDGALLLQGNFTLMFPNPEREARHAQA
jgi:predicted hotdog family 3-hydroxylacyl-ACP dehydratase